MFFFFHKRAGRRKVLPRTVNFVLQVENCDSTRSRPNPTGIDREGGWERLRDAAQPAARVTLPNGAGRGGGQQSPARSLDSSKGGRGGWRQPTHTHPALHPNSPARPAFIRVKQVESDINEQAEGKYCHPRPRLRGPPPGRREAQKASRKPTCNSAAGRHQARGGRRRGVQRCRAVQ